MTVVDPPGALEQGQVGWSPIVRVGGTGSISTRGLTDEEAADADARRVPIGFHEAVAEAATKTVAAEAAVLERELAAFGECLWTSRDIIAVVSHPDGRNEVVVR